MNKKLGIFGVALLSTISTQGLLAQSAASNGQFSLQGRLKGNNGQAVADGQHTVTVNLYTRGSGQMAYSETDQVTTVDGVFSTMVGDNGSGGSNLMIDANADYEIGIMVDNGQELSPRLRVGDAISAIHADMASNASAVGGFRVDSTGLMGNALVTTDANGRLRSSLFGNSTVTSINGLRGDINLQVTGNGVTADTTGGMLRLNFTGSGDSNGLSFPYNNALNLGSGDAFSLSNSGSGAVGVFTNNGSGSALNLSGNSTSNAALRIQNRANGSGARAISSVNASGNETFEVMANGQTMINSTVGNALNVTTTATGEAALAVNGGLRLNGPVGTSTLDLSTGSMTITNPFVKSNSIIMLTVTSATNGATIVPLRIASQENGSFMVSPIQGTLGLLTGSLSFNYLIINR